MKNLQFPKWIILIILIPSIILALIFWSDFQVIHSLLKPKNTRLWLNFAIAFSILTLSQTAYAIYLIFRQKVVSMTWSFLTLISYLTLLYFVAYYMDYLIPFSIPDWMLSGNLLLFTGTFLMPSLAYPLFVLVHQFTPNSNEKVAWINIVFAVLIPILAYLFLQVILPLWQPINNDFEEHVFIVLIICFTILFLFFLIRFIYIISEKQKSRLSKYQLLWKIPISIVLPLIGLALNGNFIQNEFNSVTSGIFGDFSSFWFFFLAVLNGIFICLPSKENKLYRLILFALRSLTFAYTFYFFLVFLPFLPISLVAIVAFGSGFLMLTPLVLFVLHSNELSKDFTFLVQFYSKMKLRLLLAVSLLILPLFITLKYLEDKQNLEQSLNYVYNPNYSQTTEIDYDALQKSISEIKMRRSRNDDFMMNGDTPYLSNYYNWLVLDNLTLSERKIETLERIFTDRKIYSYDGERSNDSCVQMTAISTRSTYDYKQKAWLTWVDLELTNTNQDFGFNEYLTTFNLPDGCSISDYYLYIEKRKEMGILAEKKSALWVYSNILNENKDPGILYYLTGNKVAFRVFPFQKSEVRKTGIQFLHKEPIQLTIDGKTIILGNDSHNQNQIIENEAGIYVSAYHKKKLKKVNRQPYFHFIVDVSNPLKLSKYKMEVEQIMNKNKSLSKNAKISCVSSKVTNFSVNQNWEKGILGAETKGGFFLERGFQKAFYDLSQNQSSTYPIFIVVSDHLNRAIIQSDFADWKFVFPESDCFYHLNSNRQFDAHSLVHKPKEIVEENAELKLQNEVLSFKKHNKTIAYLPNNQEPSLIFKDAPQSLETKVLKQRNWATAMQLQASMRHLIIHPEKVETNWRMLVKNSFESKIMTPYTSYLVVENQAQKNALLRKQKQVLSSKKSFDLDDDSSEMSEPGFIILSLLAGVLLFLKYKRKRKGVYNV